MIELSAADIASATSCELRQNSATTADSDDYPQRAVCDSRLLRPGDLFFALPGARVDGAQFAAQALAGGAWGVVVPPRAVSDLKQCGDGRIFITVDPLKALGALARRWRAELGDGKASVVAVTGSVGKTSTKDILHALLKEKMRVKASPQNYNTEIGLPLAILAVDAVTECLILELAMRGSGQIRELAQIANPTVGVITNIGPVHLDTMGSLEAVAEAKAELIAELPVNGSCVVPASAEMLHPHLRSELKTVTFGDQTERVDGGAIERAVASADATATVRLCGYEVRSDGTSANFAFGSDQVQLLLNLEHHHNLVNAAAALAAAMALGFGADDLDGLQVEIDLSEARGQEFELLGDVTVIDDCYNASPIAMRAALDHLLQVAARRGSRRRVAVLGEMAELGSEAGEYHRELGRYLASQGIDRVVAVGPLAKSYIESLSDGTLTSYASDASEAAATVPDFVQDGDIVLVKGSRSVGLERVCSSLKAARGEAGG